MPDARSDPPAKTSGDRLAAYFENFFRGVIGIATLGASLTFSKIVQTPVPPFHSYGISPKSIQYLLATSWLLFVLALAFTSFFASALSLWRNQAVAAFNIHDSQERKKVLWFASAVSALLFGLSIAAFLTLALVVVAYTGAVGWVAVFFTIVFGVLGFGSIAWQSPLQWPKWMRGEKPSAVDTVEEYLPRAGGVLHHGTTMTEHFGRHPSRQQQVGEKSEPRDYGRSTSGDYQQRAATKDEERGYGRSTSGDYAGSRWRPSHKDERHDVNRYSKASTIISDAYGSGAYGQRDVMMYDDGIREGLVVGDY